MAQPSFIAKEPETSAGPIAPVAAPAARSAEAQPISTRDAQSIGDALKAPVQPGLNPVAEVQAKLRAALTEAPEKPSLVADIVFKTLMAIACVGTTALGLTIGVACVFLGTAIYLFPLTAGLSLAAVVIGSGYLGYRLYTGSPRDAATRRSRVESGDMFEPLAAGRFSVAGVA